MEQTKEAKSKGKGIIVASSEPIVELKCPKCPKFFHSVPALSGHQNAHREPLPLDDDMIKLIPNPSWFDDLFLQMLPDGGNVSPPHDPGRRPGKEPMRANSKEEEVNSYDNPRKNPEAGEDFVSVLEKNPQYYPAEMELPEYTDDNFHMTRTQTQTLTMDLLGKWKPSCGFAGDGQPGPSSWKASDPIVKKYLTEEEVCLQIGPTASTVEYLDLELKLGF
ncbi:hypothetical protein PTKIN_Ptkin13bG0228000 [Pterospermum kingtungense]